MKKHVFTALAAGLLLTAPGVYADPNSDLLGAVVKQDAAAVTAAIDAGADVNFEGEKGETPLNSAFLSPEITKLLLEKGAKPNHGKVPALANALNSYSLEVIDLLLAAGADPNRPAQYAVDATAPLKAMVAAEKAKGKDANKFLIKAFEDQIKNAGPSLSQVSMLSLALGGAKGALKKLIDAKLDLAAKDAFGRTAFHQCVADARPVETRIKNAGTLRKMLQDAGHVIPAWYANLDASRVDSPVELVKVMIDAKQDMKAVDNQGASVFISALGFEGISAADTETILALIAAGADVKEVNEKLGSAIALAVKKGDLKVVEAMLKAGADVNAESREFDKKGGQYIDGFTPLTIAAMRDDLPMVKFLLANGARASEGVAGNSFNIKTACLTKVKNKTAIYYAIENGNLEMVKHLAEQTSFDWGKKKLVIDQMKMTSEMQIGYGLVKVTTTCFKDGEYIPSKFAKTLKQAEIAEYLKDKDL